MAYTKFFTVTALSLCAMGLTIQAQAQSSALASQISALKNSVKSFAEATNTRVEAVETKLAKMDACSQERKVYDGENDTCFSVGGGGTYRKILKLDYNTEEGRRFYGDISPKDDTIDNYYFNVTTLNTCTLKFDKSVVELSGYTKCGAGTYGIPSSIEEYHGKIVNAYTYRDTSYDKKDEDKYCTQNTVQYRFYAASDGALYNLVDGDISGDGSYIIKVADSWAGNLSHCSLSDIQMYTLEPLNF